MATVINSARVLTHIERAARNSRGIRSAAENLVVHPLLGRRIEGELRELVISYGNSGYIAINRFVIGRDEVRMLAIRHQREVGFIP